MRNNFIENILCGTDILRNWNASKLLCFYNVMYDIVRLFDSGKRLFR